MPTPLSLFYREIPLTQGKVAIVDESDFEWASQWKWFAKYKPSCHAFYAARTDNKAGVTFELHRALMGVNKGDKRVVDHINHDSLDNRRGNLRVCTSTQNSQNRRAHCNNKSGFKGVSFHPHTGKWRAVIHVNGKRLSLGLRATPEEAGELYHAAAQEHFGEFACIEKR